MLIFGSQMGGGGGEVVCGRVQKLCGRIDKKLVAGNCFGKGFL